MPVDGKHNIETRQYDDAIGCLSASIEAFQLYKKKILVADKSPFSWETVDRLGPKWDEAEIKKVEAQIAEERRKRKDAQDSQPAAKQPAKTGGSSGSTGNWFQQSSGQGGQGASGGRTYSSGACLWCHIPGHHIKNCDVLQYDYDNGDALYDERTNRFYMAKKKGGASGGSSQRTVQDGGYVN